MSHNATCIRSTEAWHETILASPFRRLLSGGKGEGGSSRQIRTLDTGQGASCYLLYVLYVRDKSKTMQVTPPPPQARSMNVFFCFFSISIFALLGRDGAVYNIYVCAVIVIPVCGMTLLDTYTIHVPTTGPRPYPSTN